jgi:hypothetical protein
VKNEDDDEVSYLTSGGQHTSGSVEGIGVEDDDAIIIMLHRH